MPPPFNVQRQPTPNGEPSAVDDIGPVRRCELLGCLGNARHSGPPPPVDQIDVSFTRRLPVIRRMGSMWG